MRKLKKMLGLIMVMIMPLFLMACEEEEQASLHSIKIHVTLHDNGSATIEERREMTMKDYTEMYITMKNLGKSELLDFYVKNYKPVDNWDSEASRIEKADKYGVIQLEEEDGYELVWGVGNYGERTYEPTYQLTNLVHQLKDGQSLYWNFDTFSQFETDDIEMIVEAPFALTEENIDYYGFGIEGEMKIEDGKLHIKPTGHFNEDSYLTLLLQFKDKSFIALDATDDQTLAEQKELATEGSSYNSEPPMTTSEKLLVGGLIGVGAATLGLTGTFLYLINKRKIEAGQLLIGPGEREKDWQPRPHIPYRGDDLADTVYVINPYVPEIMNALFAAYLTQWINEERVVMLETEETVLFGLVDYPDPAEANFDQYVDQLVSEESEGRVEEAFWLMLVENVDEEGILDQEALEDWLNDHGVSLTKLEVHLITYSMQKLEAQDYIEQKTLKVWGAKVPLQIGHEKGQRLVREVDELVQFFSELTPAQQMTLIEKNSDQWQELMVWSALLGHEDWGKEIAENLPHIWENWRQVSPFFFYYPHIYGLHQNFDTALHTSSTYTGSSSAMSVGGGAGAGGGGGGGAR